MNYSHNTKTMISVRTLWLLLLTTVLFFGCGKPNDPESIFNSGGYTIVTRYQTPANAQDLIVKDTLCFVAQGEGGLLVLDIKNRGCLKRLDSPFFLLKKLNVKTYISILFSILEP